ncbi:c-type cytochrome [Dechloromonas agitata]|uniref:c-type cytochrome n=1 Tax=Dechloromonas agitata TaxID=73030 RepID=UPI00237E50FC|nr:c-type cytochrome [Dechloromonas agitata]MDE1544807.1 c-type cytochrome [Dechloromonas agitata]
MKRTLRHLLSIGLLGLSLSAGSQAADQVRAEEIVGGRCFLCHGLKGESASAVFPRLAGQHAEYIAKQLADFKSGKRASETMKPQVEDLTPAEMKALGQFFEAKVVGPRKARDAELLSVGKYIFERGNQFSGLAACASCHGPKGLGTPQLPRLAGQHPRYIEDQLKQFNKRERTNDNAVMHTIASKLTELETHAVAEYIATLD